MCAEQTGGKRQARSQGERLQKVLANAGVASRRTCEEYITAGRVAVNGRVVTELGTRVDPAADQITLDGQPIVVRQRRLSYYLLYKPTGYLTTMRDPHGRPVARDLVPTQERLYPVGRLDYNSEGLLLFTNDGDLAYRMMHPKYEHEKEYWVLVKGRLSEEEIERLREGVQIEGESAPLFVRAEVRHLPAHWKWRGEPVPPGCRWVQVILKEGRKRQIRQMFDLLDYPVERLIRVRMGALELGQLKPGEGRWLGTQEAEALRLSLGLKSATPTKTSRGRKVEKNYDRYRRPRRVGEEHRRRPARS